VKFIIVTSIESHTIFWLHWYL